MEFLKQDFFTLLDLPKKFAINLDKLHKAYHQLQIQAHPDRYVNKSQAEQELALRCSTYINEAYFTLKNPLLRATYLCDLNESHNHLEKKVAKSTSVEFLSQQLAWREAIETAKNTKIIYLEICKAQDTQFTELEAALDDQYDYAKARSIINKLLFFEKILSTI